MTLNPIRTRSLRIVICLCFLAVLLGHTEAQSQATAKDYKNPKAWPYNERSLARAFGNVGGWWSFMNEDDKAAFLDGYQAAMRQSLSQNEALCKVLKNDVKPSSDQQAFNNQFSAAIFACSKTADSSGFEKVTAKDLDDFYSDPINQPIPLEWSMGYLRDKASGRKTEGQLLDALKAEQKDVHDCSRYPNLCKLGAKESQPSQWRHSFSRVLGWWRLNLRVLEWGASEATAGGVLIGAFLPSTLGMVLAEAIAS